MRSTPLVLASLSLLALTACATPASDETTAERLTVSWGFDKTSTDDTGMTTSDVSLLVTKDDGSTRGIDLGRFAGCGEEAAPEDGPFLTLKCWWAGAGDDFEVRMDATNSLVIYHRSLDEGADIPEFTPVRTLLLPDGAVVVPVAMNGR